ncbi:hypothetical protein [Clostridium estertheticum]|uniref:hypothetical protein n=1 Tax=Clostridium estertheticum TaxID=238834 RepID=UPI001C6E288A|nr:hypothetical protein [Clostridium estertheticum]MBW9151454.1 hypothetical protein [Clostridium estertheticum]WLC83407.1 hypothetical protein KTC97_15100 [Clostridium estertheticum]
MVINISDFDLKSVAHIFELTFEQTKLIFSIQKCMIIQDIKIEGNIEKQNEKNKWCRQWEGLITSYLDKLIKKNESKDLKNKLYEDNQELSDAICKEKSKANKLQLILLDFEVSIFRPYFSLSKTNVKQVEKSLTDYLKTYVTKLELSSKENYNSYYEGFFKLLDIDQSIKEGFYLDYLTSIRSIASLFQSVVRDLGVSIMSVITENINSIDNITVSENYVPFGCGTINTSDIDKKVDVAIAVGGFFILCDADNISVRLIYINAPAFILSQVAKLEGILKGINLNMKLDEGIKYFVISKIKLNIGKLESEIVKYREEKSINKQNEMKLKDSIMYLHKSIKRIEKIF